MLPATNYGILGQVNLRLRGTANEGRKREGSSIRLEYAFINLNVPIG